LNAFGTAGREVRFWDGWQVSIIFIATHEANLASPYKFVSCMGTLTINCALANRA